MRVLVFGKTACAKCRSAKEKLEHLISKAGLADSVHIEWVDMESIEGRAEAAFSDVREPGTTILVGDDDRNVARWDGRAPLAAELNVFLTLKKSESADQPAAQTTQP
jgi:hypothetical protein